MKQYQLCDGVEICKFDDIESANTYLVSYNEKHLKVSGFVVDVIQNLSQFETIEELTNALEQKYNNKELAPLISKTIQLLQQNGLLQGFEVQSSKKSPLWGKMTLIPQKIVNKLRVFRLFFCKPILPILTCISVLWIVFAAFQSVSLGLSEKITSLPLQELLVCYATMLIITLFHELGHASALIFCGEKPGKIGFAFYTFIPVLYSDVTNAWKLPRKKRFLVDFGGIYFQCLLSGFIYIVNLIWIKNELIHITMLLEAFVVFGDFNPFLRFDGYWMLNDLLGTTNIIAYIVHFWKRVFKIGAQGNTTNRLPFKVSLLLVLYTIGVIAFSVYFIYVVFDSLVLSLSTVYTDICYLLNNNVTVSFSSTISYITLRFSVFLVLIFAIRMLMKTIKLLQNKLRNRNSLQ